ncbi:MAG: hypothetical protein AB8B60_01360 [Sulfitobacter sp.]
MNFDYRISLGVLGVAGVVLALVLQAPALTSGNGGGSNGVSQEEFDRTVGREYAHCRANDKDVNCACFANTSGRILTGGKPRVPGADYADQTQLARSQASAKC